MRTSGPVDRSYFSCLIAARAGVPARSMPSASSMRSSWLYLATRSLRLAEPVLIWPARGADGEIGNRRVLGLAGAVRDDRACSRRRAPSAIASSVSVTVPIWLSFTSSALAMPSAMPSLEDLRVGDEHVVADQLHLRAERLGQRLPAGPVALGEAVLDRDDRVVASPSRRRARPSRPACASARPDFLKLVVLAVLVPELAGGDVEREEDVACRPCSRPCVTASSTTSSASRFDFRLGAKPPSSPTPVA